MKRAAAWKGVEDNITRKLSLWKQKSLSIGGRWTLIKSVLNSLPLYFFSLFRAMETTLHSLERLWTKFFWGCCRPSRKIVWAKDSRLHGALAAGGLGVGRLKNKTLAKWLWRFKTEDSALWVRIIKSIYGVDGGCTSKRALTNKSRGLLPLMLACRFQVYSQSFVLLSIGLLD